MLQVIRFFAFLLALNVGTVAFMSNSFYSPRLASSLFVEKKEAISKAEFIKILKEKTGFTQSGLDVVLTAFAETLRTEVLQNGKEIRLRDFGTFKLRQSSARIGRNPKTGEELSISASKAVTFSASASLKNKEDGTSSEDDE